MGCCATSGWIVLVLFTFITVLISIALLSVGGILKFTPEFLWNAPSDTPHVVDNVALPYTSEVPLMAEAGVGVMVAGAVIFVVSFVACCGACYKCHSLLIMFAVFNILMVGALTTATVLFLMTDSVLHTNVRNFLSRETHRQYSVNPEGAFIQFINIISVKMECCAITGPENLDPDWRTDPGKVTGACCKPVSDMTCQSNSPTVRVKEDIEEMGCYDRILEKVEEHKITIGLTVTSVLLVMIIEAVIAIAIVVDTKKCKNKVGPK